MTDSMGMTKEERSLRAQAILNDPVFVDATLRLKKAYMDAWAETRDAEAAQREILFQKASVLNALISEINSFASNPKAASARRENLKAK